jgi:hypothetical protein
MRVSATCSAESVRRITPACILAGLMALVVAVTASPLAAQLPADRLVQLADDATNAASTFQPPSTAALDAAASNLRTALQPLDALLTRSKSGADWREYLDWPTLQAQAAKGDAADPAALRKLVDLLSATETGLDMPDFVRVRKAANRYAEAAEAARGAGADRYAQRLKSLSNALRKAAETGNAEDLATVAPTLDRLAMAGQAPGLIQTVRSSFGRPNMLFAVHENLFAEAVNRPVDQAMEINENVLGTRVRGTGHTTGMVRLDFVPAHDRAVLDLVLSARAFSNTRGSQGPVTVCTQGTTDLMARRRIYLTEHSVSASPVEASADTHTAVTGIGISKRFGKNLIRRIATKKIAQTKPKAEAIAEGRARDRLRQQFSEQTEPALAQFREQFQSRVRGPLEARGLYPEMLHLNTSGSELLVTARKSLADQLAAASLPPTTSPNNLLTARVHESAVNNMLEQKFGGRILRQADVDAMAKEMKGSMPESLGSDTDQQPWEVTFAKQRPISVSTGDGRVKLMVRGDKFVSGDREFPGMDIWATYAIGHAPQGIMLVREGDVQIYPPGFVPGGGEKLSPAETSLRRILQRRFDTLFKSEIEIPDLPLQGELAAAGPLPLNELVARRDGWIAAGWRKKDPIVGETIIEERIVGEQVVETIVREVSLVR